MEITSIETPALLVEEPVLRRNIDNMQKFANDQGFLLYPHFKTHKSIKVAEMQMMAGAKGFTVSGLSEAELLIDNGYKNIIVAYPVTGVKIDRLYQLHKKSDGRISCIVDDIGVARSISNKFEEENEVLDIFIKVNVGLNRCGVMPFSHGARLLATEVKESPGLVLKGLLSHAGHSYHATSLQQIQGIAAQEQNSLTTLADEFEDVTGKLDWLSVGATPTAKFYEPVLYTIIFRPGNYVFCDMIQVSLGSAELKDCALSVLSSVISKPAKDRLIVDAGSKSLSLATPASDTEKIKGYGGIMKTLYRKQLNEALVIESLSEEHGIIKVKTSTKLRIGDKIRIIPNHACTATNLHNKYYFTHGEHLLSKVSIDARGFST